MGDESVDRRHLASDGMTDPDDPRPHWARMTPDGGPTYPDDPEIIKWRAAAFSKGRRYAEEDAVPTVAPRVLEELR